jgi:hypothetical protein
LWLLLFAVVLDEAEAVFGAKIDHKLHQLIVNVAKSKVTIHRWIKRLSTGMNESLPSQVFGT